MILLDMLDTRAGRHPTRPARVFRGRHLPYAVVSFSCFIGCLVVASLATAQDEAALARARQQMVEQHLRARDITDARVLWAMAKVPRHRFIHPALGPEAYADRALPIDEGQTISQPYIVALMTQLLELRGPERVLEVGTGSGYQAAILAELVKEVFTIEILPGLAKSAAARLAGLGYWNVEVRAGDGGRKDPTSPRSKRFGTISTC